MMHTQTESVLLEGHHDSTSGHLSVSGSQSQVPAHALKEVALFPLLVITITVSLLLHLVIDLQSSPPAIPIWDGQGCTSGKSGCCANSDLPWFHKDLSPSTTTTLNLEFAEMRTPITKLHLYCCMKYMFSSGLLV